MTGSRSIIASCISSTSISGASAKPVRRLPSVGLRTEGLPHLLDLGGDALPLPLLATSAALQVLLLRLQVVVLLADLHLLELAQRAQAHVEDRLGLHVGELEARIITAFGSSSSRMMRITSSRLR